MAHDIEEILWVDGKLLELYKFTRNIRSVIDEAKRRSAEESDDNLYLQVPSSATKLESIWQDLADAGLAQSQISTRFQNIFITPSGWDIADFANFRDDVTTIALYLDDRIDSTTPSNPRFKADLLESEKAALSTLVDTALTHVKPAQEVLSR